jgi:hypothetical protein
LRTNASTPSPTSLNTAKLAFMSWRTYSNNDGKRSCGMRRGTL